MSDDLINIYEASHLAEAEMIHQALESAGIKAYVEQTASPLDGLTAAGEGTDVMVRSDDADRAREVIEQYLAEKADDDTTGGDA
ncbi:MAG: hypothetical protein GC159_04215 [Phycisphaera sp.]|nr:hypothetical protein [Phycisphaera sp.]